MRVALLADAASVHTQRWALAYRNLGIPTAIWSERDWPEAREQGIFVTVIPRAGRGRWNFPLVLKRLRQSVRRFAPSVVHAHYVSRYGLYGALLGIKPLVVSVWGADVEVFPTRHRWASIPMLQAIFARAARITATSHYLAQVTRRYCNRPVAVIPFGIDTTRFCPTPPNAGGHLRWVVNKALEPVYGLDLLFSALAELPPELPWEGRILGEGSQAQELRKMAEAGGFADRLTWTGRVPHEALPECLAWADVGLYPSRRESFGVAPLEMMALGRAVVAHRIGGLAEVVQSGHNGYLIAPGDVPAWRQCLQAIMEAPEAVRRLGQNGPAWVKSRYRFADNVSAMLELYRGLGSRD